MKNLPLAALLTLTSLAAVNAAQAASAPSTLTINQGAQTWRLASGPGTLHQITMKNRMFEIVADKVGRDVAIQVCAKPEDEVVKAMVTGSAIEQHPCFAPGAGMAMPPIKDPKEGLPLLVTARNAHNYYSRERRLDSGKTATVFVNDFDFVRMDPVGTVYMVVVIDRNGDNVLQDDEFWHIQVQLKAPE